MQPTAWLFLVFLPDFEQQCPIAQERDVGSWRGSCQSYTRTRFLAQAMPLLHSSRFALH